MFLNRTGLTPALWLTVLLLCALMPGCGGGKNSSGGGPTPGPTVSPPPSVASHVFLVVLENHSFNQVIGSPSMPYLNSLASQNSLATNYFGNAHPSIGNYFMLTTGVIESTDDAFTGTVTDDNLVRALSAAGKTWKAYFQSIPSQGYLGPDVFPYLRHHNPFSYFSDVQSSMAEAANIVPLSQLSTDMSANALPAFGFVKPDVEHDAHDCPGGGAACADSDRLAAADAWLQQNIDPLIKSQAFSGGVLIITWDEGQPSDPANGGGQVATMLLGNGVKTKFTSGTMFQHQSTLRLILDLLGVTNHPGASATAPGMGEFFQ
ncbi:MAG TPA: alkaline phosphatase family protein [Terriglobales bacterium]|nr:alkaline phosphatase family protein [Terriglobales bacterium]